MGITEDNQPWFNTDEITYGGDHYNRTVVNHKLGGWDYPLVNIQKTTENHHFQWVHPLQMAMFNSKLLNYQRVGFWSQEDQHILLPQCHGQVLPCCLFQSYARLTQNLPPPCVGSAAIVSWQPEVQQGTPKWNSSRE